MVHERDHIEDVRGKEGIVMMKYWRIWLMVLVIFGSLMAIGFKTYPYGRNAVEIVYFSDDSPARGVLEQGMVIHGINDEAITGIEKWNEVTRGLTGEVTIRANGRTFTLEVNESLGIDVAEIQKNNLNFGLDLRGGTRIVLKPKDNATKETIEQVISTLQTRANLYGLKEMNFIPVRDARGEYLVLIEVAGINRDIVDDLLSTQGKFEAKISKPVQLIGDSGTIQIGPETFPVRLVDDEDIEIGGETFRPGDSLSLSDIELEYVNTSGNVILFMAKAYDGNDIELVFTDPQRSGVVPVQGGYNFFFGVSVSTDGAQRFADITTGVPSYLDLASGERYLESVLFIYIDDQPVSDLRISADLGGKLVQTPQVTGSRTEQEDAINEKLRLQTILRSGALPTSLEVEGIDIISPALGEDFAESTMYAAMFAAGLVVLIVFIRYRNLKIALPMILVGLSEVVIILGISAVNDSLIWGSVMVMSFIMVAIAWWKKHDIDLFAWTGVLLIPLLGMASWTIDLPAIGGIIAAIGTGVDHQIIIADETLSGRKDRKVYTIKEKMARAFFIIFGAAATSIGAMVPLMTIGIGFLRGFAITTIVGVLVGILITRPAYARIVEALNKE
jgi:preprotein translocase subunit SecD